MHFFKIFGFDFLLTHEPSPIPEADERHPVFKIKADAEFYFFMEWNSVNGELQVVERDSPIGIDLSSESITKNIVESLIRFWQGKGSEEASLFRHGFFESGVRDFLRGRMDSLEAVLVEFQIKNFSGLLYFCDPFPDTGSHQMVLEPAIRSLHFSLGGWAQGINHFDV